jgi:hypothetical protein
MNAPLFTFLLAFGVSAFAEEVRINLADEDLKKMAEFAKQQADHAEARVRRALSAAETKKKMKQGARK